jgi:hypothetical protein
MRERERERERERDAGEKEHGRVHNRARKQYGLK